MAFPDALTLAVEQHGGTVAMGKMEIPTVGHLFSLTLGDGVLVEEPPHQS